MSGQAGFDLFDIAEGKDEKYERLLENRRRVRALARVRPDTGETLPDGKTWCGRCGETVSSYDLVCNHDLGYAGCPHHLDPVFREGEKVGWRGRIGGSIPMTIEHLNTRWDRAWFADCQCGHGMGLHGAEHGGLREGQSIVCYAYCGCQGYEPVSSPAPGLDTSGQA